jgi:hypothetical protein
VHARINAARLSRGYAFNVAAALRADDLDRWPYKRDLLVLSSSQKAIADEGNGIILAYFGELDGLQKIRP